MGFARQSHSRRERKKEYKWAEFRENINTVIKAVFVLLIIVIIIFFIQFKLTHRSMITGTSYAILININLNY